MVHSVLITMRASMIVSMSVIIFLVMAIVIASVFVVLSMTIVTNHNFDRMINIANTSVKAARKTIR